MPPTPTSTTRPASPQGPERAGAPDVPDAPGDPTPLAGPEAVLATLRAEPVNPHLLRGFGPLVALVVLAVLMVVLLPTVAREQVVDRPAGEPASAVVP